MNDGDVRRLLRRAGLRCGRWEESRSYDGALPENARLYLKPNNERLRKLQVDYSRESADAMDHTQWNREYVVREIDLQLFRADSAYMWQHRDFNLPVSYLCTYYYLKQCNSEMLECCSEDTLFGVHALEVGDQVITRDRLDSVCELSFIQSALDLKKASKVRLLDIGCGYGRFAYRTVQCFPTARVVCADAIPESSFLCEFYLHFRDVAQSASICEFQEVRARLSVERIDLAVAINSLSECSARAISWWMRLLAESNIKYLFFVPSSFYEGGKRAFSEEIDRKDSCDIMQIFERHGYKIIRSAPKYDNSLMQECGVSPSYYHLLEQVK